jgi:hypothetical protein
LPFEERATRLLQDTLSKIHDEIFRACIDRQGIDLDSLGRQFDLLSSSISEIAISSPAVEKGTATHTDLHRVHFGAVSTALGNILSVLGRLRLLLLFDEWSVIPLDLQPYMADFIRRALMPLERTTIKIAAIEHRSRFRLTPQTGEYIGIEIGADVASDINLDDFMVFDNNADRATNFFKNLLFRHYWSIAEASANPKPETPEHFVKQAFSQITPFRDLVAAAEGVPRDAINILVMSAQRAGDDAISIAHVRTAAKNWYQRDKDAAIESNQNLRSLLHWIIDQVIAGRKARAFLLRSGVRHDLIDALFDARVLHIVKRGVASHDQPGVRYDVYKIDYGCYVDLLATQTAPKGLLQLDDPDERASHIEVPPDDYRAIRRAILNLDDFFRSEPDRKTE